MAKAKTVAMPDFIPDEQLSQYESAPDFIPDEEIAGVSQPPVNAAEELRAKRVRTASPQELRKIHFGENVPAGVREDQRSILGEAAQGALVRGPAKALASIPEIPNLLSQSISQPAQVGKQVAGAPAEIYRKLSSGTPTETGEAAFDVGSMAIPAAKGLASGARAGLTRLETKAGQVLTKGAERSKSLTYGALSEGVGHRTARAQRLESEINKGLEPVFDFAAQSKRKINNVNDLQTAAKDMVRVTDAEFNQAVQSVGDRLVSGKPIADEIRKEITDLAKTTNPSQAANLERIAASFDRDMPISEVNQLRQEANNVLDKFYSKSPLQQEHPAIGIAAQSAMADGLRVVLYDNLEQMFPDSALRQMMRERGAAEGISKYASESSGATRRIGMAETEVGGLITTPLTKGTKLAKAAISPRETLGKGVKHLQRPDKKISEAFKLYIPKKSTIAAPIGKPGPHGLRPQGPTPDDLLQNAGGQIRYNPGPRPISGGSGNALSPNEPVRGSWFDENASNLQPEVRDASRAQAAQGPLTAYHGTGNQFETYHSGEGIGPHFGTKEQANAFATEAAQSGLPGHVRKEFLDIKNPLKVDFDSGWENPSLLAINLEKAGVLKPGEGAAIGAAIFDKSMDEAQAFAAIRQKIASQGYDAIAYPNRFEGQGTSYIPLSPENQVITGSYSARGGPPVPVPDIPLSSYMNQTQDLSPASLQFHQNFERTAGQRKKP